MKKSLGLGFGFVLLFSSKVNAGILSAGIKGAGGIGISWNADTFFFSQFGIGGYHELKYKFIGFEMDYMYERDGDVGSDGKKTSDIFKLNIYGKLIGGPYYISVGPEFVWNGGWDGDTFLSIILGYNLHIPPALNLIFEFPKVSTSFWEDEYKYFDIQLRIGLGITLF